MISLLNYTPPKEGFFIDKMFRDNIEQLQKEKPLYVMKFGGTSVGGSKQIERTTQILKDHYRRGDSLVVVVSAVRGVTDSLVRICNSIDAKKESDVELVIEDSIVRHQSIIDELALSLPLRQTLQHRFDTLTESLWNECIPIQKLNLELKDRILRYGEMFNAPIVASSLVNSGVIAEPVDASEIIETDNNFGDAIPNLQKTQLYARRKLLPLIENNIIPVVTGFIGATKDYKPTTLGRGGSDYTASILGAILPADEVWIWTDVDGIYDRDPRKNDDAKILPVLRKEIAHQMAMAGAKVLYPKTIEPLFNRPINLRVKNTFNPNNPGTKIID